MQKISAKIGAHVSIADGIVNAPSRAHALGCETFQCFTRSPQGGKAPELTKDVVKNFRLEMKKYKMKTFYIHTPYYINLASLSPRIRHSSRRVIREELERGSVLGAKYIMTHIGSYSGQSLKEGLLKASKGLREILAGYTGKTKLLIEISAGSGSILGDTFEEIGEMLKDVPRGTHGIGGVCFDTCHAFASGYDFRTKEGIQRTLKEFDKYIGLNQLKLTHVNDSKSDLNEKKDRHEHIGYGYIGEKGMGNILTSKPFTRIDWLLETPKDDRGNDVKKLRKIRGF